MKRPATIAGHVDTIRTALSALCPTGHHGFEGLVGASFSAITGMTFRLSSGGSQFGIDGKSAYGDPSVSFECKLYQGHLGISTVNDKLCDLAVDDHGIDLWALCATTQVSAQIAARVRRFGKQLGISTVVLDWAEFGVPPLVTMLSMASHTVESFLSTHAKKQPDVGAVRTALEAIREHKEFASQAERIRQILTAPTTGLEAARVASAKWLCEAFSDRQTARLRLEQPLAPGDSIEGTTRDRQYLVDKIRGFLGGRSPRKVLHIIGEEGSGKSWSVAQSWLRDPRKPMMLFISPSVFEETAAATDIQSLLVTSIIRQTEDDRGTTTTEKWFKVLSRLRRSETDQIRFVVLVDGVNQRPKKEWGRTLDKLGDELRRFGGQLIVTSRTSYFRNHIANVLTLPHEEVEVPEWTQQERDAILESHGIVGAELRVKLASALCNPRILGIALRLWTGRKISGFHELSVNRLLFEHLHMSEKDAPSPQPVHETVQFIRAHAADMLAQLRSRSPSGLSVSESEVHSVVEGRFFVEISDDPGRYELTEEGLPLALAFLVIDKLRQCRRQARDMIECLDEIVEPISALDRTSEVLVSAITVTCLDDRYDEDMTVALLRSFADLQNLTKDYYHELINLASVRVIPFARVAHRLCLRGGTQPNFDLITRVFIAATRQDVVWSVVREYVESWLTLYTIGPRSRPQPFSEAKEDREEKREQELSKFRSKIDQLSLTDKSIIEGLREVDGDLESLASLAFVLLASRPRVPAARSVVHCAYALALSTDYYRHGDDLAHFIQLNRLDWVDAREGLLRELEPLRSEDVSTDGKWALVRVLRATGDPDDAVEATALSERLTEGEKRLMGSWRLVEQYCATDPCDPASAEPDNVGKTAREYSLIEFNELDSKKVHVRGASFFDMARTAVARFDRKRAANKHIEYAQGVISAAGSGWHPGLHDLRQHNALLDTVCVRELLSRVEAMDVDDHDTRGERWTSGQFRLLLAFPFLSGLEQIDVLRVTNTCPILDLVDSLRPISDVDFSNRLELAYGAADEIAQYFLLMVANLTTTPVSSASRRIVANLLSSDSERVRVEALGLTARLRDRGLLLEVIRSDWCARDSGWYEGVYGSRAVLAAASCGVVDYKSALRRMSPRLFGVAAREWDSEGLCDIAEFLDVAIHRATKLEEPFQRVLEIDVRWNDEARQRIGISSESIFTPSESGWERLKITEEEFLRRQKEAHREFEAFEESLKQAGCDIILDHVGLDAFRRVVEADHKWGNRWYDLFAGLQRTQIHVVRNLIVLLGHALASRKPDKAVALFRLVKDCEPLTIVRYGHARVPLESLAIWGGPNADALNRLRWLRLDEASSDAVIAQETLAAHLKNKQDLLDQYVKAKLEMGAPAERARALMVVGFSDQRRRNDDVLEKYRGTPGFIGDVCDAAVGAYDRNSWGRHWYNEMRKATDPVEFWGASVLFLKVVDGRYDLWSSEYEQTGEIMDRFWPNLRSALSNRMRKWQNARARKLFGKDVPKAAFLSDEGSSGPRLGTRRRGCRQEEMKTGETT